MWPTKYGYFPDQARLQILPPITMYPLACFLPWLIFYCKFLERVAVWPHIHMFSLS